MKQDWKTGLIGNIYLERYLLGELSESQILALETRLARDPVLKQRLEAMRTHNQTFETQFPPNKMVREIEAAAAPARNDVPRSRPITKPNVFAELFAVIPLGRGFQWTGAFALLVLTILPMVMVTKPSGPEITRLKGRQAELRLYRDTPKGPEQVASGDSAASGDIFQVEFHPGNLPFGAIYSVDGNGSVTLHWPKYPITNTAWSTVTNFRLPEAFQLDHAPYFERFHLVISKNPIDLKKTGALVAASAKADEKWLATQLPKSVHVIHFVLNKAAHP